MKRRDFIKRTKRQVRTNKEFERLCEKMMDNPSFAPAADVSVDNEFYAHFGISSEDALAQLYAQKADIQNQKHKPIY